MNNIVTSKKKVTLKQFYDFDYKDSCRVATTANGTLSSAFANGQTIDGVTLATGNRILIKNQTAGAVNGIYTVNASGAPTRAIDANSSSKVTSGLFTSVSEGTANADKSFVLTTNDAIVLDTDAIAFAEITSSISGLDATKIANGTVTSTEFQYINTLSSNAQTQINTLSSAKANLASPTFTGTVGGINKTMVGLSNVDNTADTAKPVSTAQQTALNLKANLASPTFTGTVSGVTKAHVGLGSADNTADTAKPVSTAQQTALNLKANLTGATFTGQVDATTFVGTKNILAHVIHDPTATYALGLPTSYAIVGGGYLKTTFTPPTGITDVIVETQCYILSIYLNRHIYLGLSGHSGSTTYSEFLGAYSISGGRTTEAFVGYGDYKYRNSVTHKWHLVGLTPGTSYHINLGAKGSNTGCYVNMGGAVGKGDLAVYYYDSTHGFAGEGAGGS
tara:strand:+ start:1857 stop:3203 length:1347 start_codon:yes stop_codon:yes gene_type:complete